MAAGPYANPAYNNAAIQQYASLYGVDPSQIQYVNGQFQVATPPGTNPSGSSFQPSYTPGQFATGGGVNPSPLNPVDYASNSTAQQVAGLTGGQVVPDTAMGTGTGAGINIPTPNGIQLPNGTVEDAGVIANLLSRGYSPESAAQQLSQQSGGAINVTPQQVQQFMGAPTPGAAPNPNGPGWLTQQGRYNPATAAAAPAAAPGAAPAGAPAGAAPAGQPAAPGAAPPGGAPPGAGGTMPPSPTGPGSYGPAGGLNGPGTYQPTSLGSPYSPPGTMSPQSLRLGQAGVGVTDAGGAGAGSFQLPVGQPPNPSDPNVSNQYQYGIYGYGQSPTSYSPGAVATGTALPSFQSGYVSGSPTADTDPQASMEEIYAANRAGIASTGAQIGGEAASQLNYYSPIQQEMQSAQNTALNNLNATPGYTPQEASAIGIDYSQFNTTPGQYAAMAGNPNAPVQQLAVGEQQVDQSLQNYQAALGTQVSGLQTGVEGAAATGGANETAALYSGAGNVRGAVGGLASGINSAYGAFDPLNAAVNNSALGFDPYGTEKQLTNQDVQGLVTQAGTTVGNQYQANLDTLYRQAAAAGNTSPAALEAMRQQLLTQEGSATGDAMTNARISALQAQFARAQGIEAQREGAVQTQAGMQATAATTEEAARQAGATTAGQAGIAAEQGLTQEALNTEALQTQQAMQAQEAAGQAGIGAAENFGQFNTSVGVEQNQQSLGAMQTADQQAAARAAAIAGMGYQQGTTSAALTSQGAQTIGNARIAGQAAYRSGVAQQQGMAQQGGQAAVGQQLGAYQTQTGGQNSAASSQGAFEVGKPSLGDTAGKQLTGLFADGGIADKPQIAKLAEKGPELVIPMPRNRYRPAPRMERMAA